MQKKLYVFIKWAFASVAYAFLAYKLIIFKHYNELYAAIKSLDLKQFVWLTLFLLLLIPNLILEARKWQLLNRNVEHFSLITSLKAIVAGISTGFFTPNRIGEMAGRVLYLTPENRRKGIILSIISGLTMSLTVLIVGIPALAMFLFFTNKMPIDNKILYFFITIFLTIIILSIYFLLPIWGKKIAENIKFPKLQTFFSHLQNFDIKDLFSILCIALARYFVFCVQMYCMLSFFGINLAIIYSITGICTNYLLITFTPSFSYSEGAVRGSYAALIFGAFGANPILCIFAGLCIWLVNTMLPVLFGTFFVLKNKNT